MLFITSNFPEFQLDRPQGALTNIEDTQKKITRVWSYYRQFCSRYSPETAPESLETIVGYMMYRIAGEQHADNKSGAICLSTFIYSELPALCSAVKRFVNCPLLSIKRIRNDPLFKRAVVALKSHRGENTAWVHARPIWFQDELRLKSVMSRDTAGIQDKALLSLLIVSGSRVSAVLQIRFRLHVHLNERSNITVFIPSVKQSNGDRYMIDMSSNNDFRAWIECRRGIFEGSPWLFIGKTGQRMSSYCATLMVARLSAYAGYGRTLRPYSTGETLSYILPNYSTPHPRHSVL